MRVAYVIFSVPLHIGAMNRRQHIMALSLAAVLLVAVLATAAKSNTEATRSAQIEISVVAPATKPLRDRRVTSIAKNSSQRSAPMAQVLESQPTVWQPGPSYDLDLTSQASIYVLYTPR